MAFSQEPCLDGDRCIGDRDGYLDFANSVMKHFGEDVSMVRHVLDQNGCEGYCCPDDLEICLAPCEWCKDGSKKK